MNELWLCMNAWRREMSNVFVEVECVSHQTVHAALLSWDCVLLSGVVHVQLKRYRLAFSVLFAL